jgi:choline dehydrogenase-like flavoprotein
MDDYDVIIVGTGAGGGTLARHLAPSGKRILLLERGDWLPREPQNWLAQDVFVDNRYISADTWYDASGKPFQPQIHYFVGGATKLYGAALYRLREEDFGDLKHHDGISPAWPISYDELEPYYTKAEHLYEVHGIHGEDPTEPYASADYPFPAVSHEPRIQQLSDDLAAAGYNPFHAPCGIRLNEANMPYSVCVRCANCDGFPCAVHGKSDAEVLGVRPALEHSNVELLTNAQAVKLETADGGKTVSGVVVEHDGGTRTYTADLVVLAAGAANTAKLLLVSATDEHPAGLANGSDQVGRNYMFHNSQAVLALSKDENPTVFQKTLGLNDFYFAGEAADYPLGNIQMVGKSQAPMFRGEKPGETKLAPQWSLEKVAAHAIDFWLSTEDLPVAENRVTVDGDGKLTLSYTATNEQPKQELYAAALDAAQAANGARPPLPPLRVLEERHPGRGLRAPGGHRPHGRRPGHLGRERRLPRPRGRQPLRGRHERLPVDRRRQPGADGDGELAPGRRPPARADGGERGGACDRRLGEGVHGAGDDQPEQRERDCRLQDHRVLGPERQGHHVGRAERGRVREAEVEVVEEHRPPARRGELGAQLLREGEVDRDVLPRARERAAAVDQPVEHREREVVPEPDQAAGCEQLLRRVRHADALDQVVDQDRRGPEGGGNEQAHEPHDQRPQPPFARCQAGRVAEEQEEEQHALDRRQQPRHVDYALRREPEAESDVQDEEREQRQGRRPA